MLPELISWFSIGIIALIMGIFSFKMFLKLPIYPYLYQSLALLCFGAFGFSLFFYRLLLANELLQIPIVCFCLTLQFYAKFFRELFGKYRRYELIQLFLASIFGAIMIAVYLFPAKIFISYIIIAPQIVFLMVLYVLSFSIIVVDYTIFSLRKIIREHLALKLSYFSLTIIASIICTGIACVVFIMMDLPLYNAFHIQIVFLTIMLILLMKHPNYNFLALVSPQFLAVNHCSGLRLYSYQFQPVEQQDLLGGALSAVNAIFKETLTGEEIEQIQFRGKSIYANYKPHFSVIYIDKVYIPFISQVLKEFGNIIAKKLDPELSNFKGGNVSNFEVEIDKEMRRFFYFLPQLLK